MAPPLVLVVDDEPDLVELVTLTLSRMQLATQSAGDVATAKKLLKAQKFDLCLTDMRLPDGDGLDLLEWMGTHCPGVPCAVITAHGNVESAVRALKLGAFDFVSKPLDLGVLRRIVSTALKLSQSVDTSMSTRTGTQLIGAAPAMDRLREMILRVSRSQARSSSTPSSTTHGSRASNHPSLVSRSARYVWARGGPWRKMMVAGRLGIR